MVSALLGEAETGFVEGAILEVSLGACRGIQVKVGTRIEPSRQKDQPVQRARVQDIEYSKVLSGCKKIRRKRA